MTTVYIAACPLGVFAFDKNGKLLDKEFFKGSDSDRAASLAAAGKEELSPEEEKLVERLGKEIVFEVKKNGHMQEFPNPAGEALRSNLSELTGKSREELAEIFRSTAAELSRKAVKASVTDDKLLVQAVNSIDDVEKTANLLVLRLREWYGLYYPELVDRVSSNEKFAELAAEKKHREEEDSMGGDLKQKDVDEIMSLAGAIVKLYDEKQRLEKYVEKKAAKVMPNSCQLVSPMLAARMVAAAGTLDRLARFPSSTIQIIGAEKALFRHMRGKGTSPKHGLLFQSPLVNQAPKKLRGKVARAMASKLSIALKLDRYGKKPDDKLKKQLEEKVKRIMVKK